ncbi:MAG: c-type cytochrome, partial [Pseudolabrys sp.]|nr:c-type cytochrome [Pseudolabrys sp.]
VWLVVAHGRLGIFGCRADFRPPRARPGRTPVVLRAGGAAGGAGGFDFPGPWGVSTSRNITSSKTKGIGEWTDAEIKRAITQGVSRDGGKLKPPMGYEYYAKMTDADLDAIVAYLRTVPAVE